MAARCRGGNKPKPEKPGPYDTEWYGTCPECEGCVQIRKDGNLAVHYPRRNWKYRDRQGRLV